MKPDNIRKKYKDLPLARKITVLSIAVIFLVMLLFTAIVQIFFEKAVVDIASSGYIQKFEAVSKNCVMLFADAERLTKVLCTDEDIQSWLSYHKEKGLAEYVRKTMKVERSLDYIDAIYPDHQFSSITVFNNRGDMVNTNNIRTQKEIYAAFFAEIEKQPGTRRWIDLYEVKIAGYEQGGIAYVRPYRDYKTGKVQGYVMVEYDTQILKENFEQLRYGKEGSYLIVDKSNGNVKITSDKLLAHTMNNKDFLEQVIIQNSDKQGYVFKSGKEKYLLTVSGINTLPWRMIGVTPMNSLTEQGKIIVIIFYAVGLTAMVFSIFLNYYMAHSVTRPLSQLANTMERFGKGELTVTLPIDSRDETGMLAGEFNKMAEEISQLIDTVYEEQRAKRKSEIAALQAQINPHFLYNTLNSVCSLIKVDKSEEAYNMVYDVGQFYRTSLSDGRIVIPISEEVANVESYIKIQSIRYGAKIMYDIKIQEEIKQNYIVKLTLQPLVENAIYHGIKELEKTGYIEVRGYKEAEVIHFMVRDNGIGMTKETIEMLFKQEESKPASFGLYSIHQRIQLYFGKEYGLQIKSSQGEGTSAIVTIPCIEEWNE